ncbi:MAG: hypothetical protein ACJAQT_001218 [Akkermansiaceae bacterium]|jgi:hypothetical protein
MKKLHAIGTGAVLFAAGLFTGKAAFPQSEKSETTKNQAPLSSLNRRISDEVAIPFGSSADLISFIDPLDPFGTERKFAKAFEDLNSTTLLALFQDLEKSSRDDPNFFTVRSQIFHHLTLADPTRALDTLLACEDQRFQQQALGLVIQHLGKTDFATARIAVRSLEDDGLRREAHFHLTNLALEIAPESLGDLLAEVEPAPPIFSPMGTTGLLTNGNFNQRSGPPTFNQPDVITRWAEQDPDAALAWAENLSDTTKRQSAMSSVLRTIAKNDPQKAAGILASIRASGVRQMLDHLLLDHLAYNWVASDRKAGLAWIKSLPVGQMKNKALSSAINQISRDDPRAAIPLLAQLTLKARESKLADLAKTWAMKDLPAAKSWVKSIDNPHEFRTGNSKHKEGLSLECPEKQVTLRRASLLAKSPARSTRETNEILKLYWRVSV